MSAWVRLLRIHQWLKNLLVFVPLVVSGQFWIADSVLRAFGAFIAFSLLASSTYIVNDLADLEADRRHPRKRHRPLAARRIPVLHGAAASVTLLALSASLAIALGPALSAVLGAYLVATLGYSLVVKRYFGMDVVLLSILYTLRIFAGTSVIDVRISFWLFAFSVFFFLGLALVKRCAELRTIESQGESGAAGRNYGVDDYAIMAGLGVSASMVAVLVFCLYVNENTQTGQYAQADLLWLIVPGLTYWLMRMWVKTHRGEMTDDPIVFSVRDGGTRLTALLCVAVAVAAQVL